MSWLRRSALKPSGYGEPPRQPDEHPEPDGGAAGPPPEPLDAGADGEARSAREPHDGTGSPAGPWTFISAGRTTVEPPGSVPVLKHHGYGDGRTTGRMSNQGGDFMWRENGDHLTSGISDNGGNVSQLEGQPPTATTHGWGDLSWAKDGGRRGVGR
jgi:hypothetical protein